MKIQTFVLGDFQTNCYILRGDKGDGNCLIIDPGYGADEILTFLEQGQLQPEALWLTHGHCDHIAGIPALLERYPELPVLVPEGDAGMITDDMMNLSAMMGRPLGLSFDFETFAPGEPLSFAGREFATLFTPGHTPGSVSFYCEQERLCFSGDALFSGSIGRTDFPGGDHEQLVSAIREQLFALPDETVVLSGHGPQTTIGREKAGNPYCALPA